MKPSSSGPHLAVAPAPRHDDPRRHTTELGDRLIESSKEIQALGAFNSSDRSVAMDMLRKQARNAGIMIGAGVAIAVLGLLLWR